MLQELIQFGRFDFELGNYGNHHDSLVLVDRRLAAFDRGYLKKSVTEFMLEVRLMPSRPVFR